MGRGPLPPIGMKSVASDESSTDVGEQYVGRISTSQSPIARRRTETGMLVISQENHWLVEPPWLPARKARFS